MRQINKKFIPGSTIYVVERDECGNACDFSGRMLLSTSNKFVITSAFIYGYDGLEETLLYHSEETAENLDTDLAVFPIEDCYETLEEAKSAFENEVE